MDAITQIQLHVIRYSDHLHHQIIIRLTLINLPFFTVVK